MRGKYSSWFRFLLVKVQRAILRLFLPPLVHWKKQELSEGYTIIIGCVTQLPALVVANLSQLAKQNLQHAREVILVFDKEPLGGLAELESRIRALNLPIPHRIICYGKLQQFVAGAIDWCWVYCWLSWCIGLAASRTKHAVLHDLDAMLVKREFLEERYQLIQSENAQFLSTAWYKGNGIDPEDELCTTFELFLDIQFLQKNFRPLDLFSHVAIYKGKSVDFDLLLYAQTLRGKSRRLLPRDLDMVHPAELITQFRFWMQDNCNFKLRAHSLPMLVYFLWIGGETSALLEAPHDFRRSGQKSIILWGKAIPIHEITVDYMNWLIEQITRLETAIAGHVRPEVREYIDCLRFKSAAPSEEKSHVIPQRSAQPV